MMRKKKRQSDREAELALVKEKEGGKVGPAAAANVGLEREDIAGHALLNMMKNERNGDGERMDNLEETTNKGGLDLNCDPHREEDILAEAAGMSLTTLMNAVTLPLEMYLGQNGVPSMGQRLLSRTEAEGEENGAAAAADGGPVSGDLEQENNREKG